ncbi:MAG: hypothetical protein KDB14_01485, partial [Planctomycetales bacterium]|nr:hypothetical protein [Planctomycetales bacterium]
LVDGVDRFLLKQLAASVEQRATHWQVDVSSTESYERSIAANRARLSNILGLRDARRPFDSPQLVGDLAQAALIAETNAYRVLQVRWPVVGGIIADGLLLEPKTAPVAQIVAVGDADQTPESLVGLQPGTPAAEQFARRLAESGCRVLIPALVDRTLEKRNGRANLTSREYLYRSAFELGRHLIGYEVAAIQAGVDWFSKTEAPIGVVGWGEGGMLTLYAGAVDPRIQAVFVSGFFGPREGMWDEPIDRNVFSLLVQFGGAELTRLIAPRALIIEASRWPEVSLPSEGGAPATLRTPELDAVQREFDRAKAFPRPESSSSPQWFVSGDDGRGGPGTAPALQALLSALKSDAKLAKLGAAPVPPNSYQPRQRQAELIHAIDRHNQWLLRESSYVREEFMKELDTSTLESYQRSVEKYRDHFRHEVVGHFDLPRLAPNVRTRLAYDMPKWRGYDVLMDVFPDVIAYGVLLVPKDIPAGDRRPVVVCQHGLEGRPRDTIEKDHRAYHDFAAKLAERGFVTFAPQNLYLFTDRFRTLQRKANPLKKTLFSIIVPQHQQITDWLGQLPFVDKERIGFYGLSYGGKSAMRIPPLVSNYCLSICSADFNEWVWKNASTRAKYSYVWTGEYEIFEFDLGSTFNYAEMAALIAPRPFMVERGHFDGVAPDEKVAHEFAKVRRLYSTGLKLPDRAEIEWFVGPHTINGQGTYKFLHKHLRWPEP